MSQRDRVTYDFAVLRLVPHVHLYGSANVGVVLHAREREFLKARVVDDTAVLGRLAPEADAELLANYLRTLAGVAGGDPDCGPLALLPESERFHWITAPRSDLLQCSPIHGGRAQDLDETLSRLFDEYVRSPDGARGG